ncbi:M20 family metallopeptidase [Tuwongella immobilis]|uniref:Peptidase M20 dimerisation domain-containing protein n=1 Tax=Tuwongella immobilis TaxID=692036 RepID=A0A6C2YI48_9BACT|nr:M20/M25/M40 family metallo-hydrolase [Tuwongella immobilis]VIP00941.1 acetylornithine deacetylase : N-formyl-4-amino-5-aminomethyl-2-methylpyrimidine deformylase OS=Virgibacillus sp. Vm-5 GN=BN990_00952 PE=4 SV=1: Peptidase_M20 [Tuwongella immobilis]VTR97300.1 acetylornithine deacetylase : N-formyl-4-amino-5-aminomethyl-2-methylpyrimidine deformylase OS=Virgibacillus sp. Vm-5 GN=BN990_00952 PE=4 SV=1: Peptidase_M20 [Tuwongella immobilis]
MTALPADCVDRIRRAINRDRLLATATELIAVPSPTGQAGAVSDRLAELITADGFAVRREIADHPAAPAVLATLDSGKPGPTMQFNGHLDVVHLPFVPPRVEGNRLLGSGSCDMKAGVAAAWEAVRALRDADALPMGKILFSANDLHEAPWGLGEQLNALIRAGIHGDAVLIPESLRTPLPIAGRGSATWKLHLRRSGEPVHEVYRPMDEPSVIAAAADWVARLEQFDRELAQESHPLAGAASVFIGQIHSGEIYNQYPQVCMIEGTRRWLDGTSSDAVRADFFARLDALARDRGVTVDCEWKLIREAFQLDPHCRLVEAFQANHALLSGEPLPIGAKRFVDDGNSFWGIAGIPAITHGPIAAGAHTVHEWVDLDDLVRVATLYALTAVSFCSGESLV